MSDNGSHLIPCHEAVRRLWDYLDDTASEVDRAEVREHLAFCRRCCGELEFVEHLRALLAAQASEEHPSQAVQRLNRFVEEL